MSLPAPERCPAVSGDAQDERVVGGGATDRERRARHPGDAEPAPAIEASGDAAHAVPAVHPDAGTSGDDAPTGDAGSSSDDAAFGDADEGGSGGPEQAGRPRPFIVELPLLVLVAFGLALLLQTFLVQAFYIPSESMVPTLEVGDRVLVNKLSHELREPQRGEVVVFRHDDRGAPSRAEGGLERLWRTIVSGFGASAEETDFIKRVIGLPGETIELRGGALFIDGAPVPEAPDDDGGYLAGGDLADFGPEEIPEGEYFMMGDNRANSSDSRSLLGTIEAEAIVGRAFVIVWPFGNARVLAIPDYDEVAVGTQEPAGAAG